MNEHVRFFLGKSPEPTLHGMLWVESLGKSQTNTNLKNLGQNNQSQHSPKLVAFIFCCSQVLFFSLFSSKMNPSPNLSNPPTIPKNQHLGMFLAIQVIPYPLNIILSDLQPGRPQNTPPQKRGCVFKVLFIPSPKCLEALSGIQFSSATNFVASIFRFGSGASGIKNPK